MNPKIADFGLAKLIDRDQTQTITAHLAGTLLVCCIIANLVKHIYVAPKFKLAFQIDLHWLFLFNLMQWIYCTRM